MDIRNWPMDKIMQMPDCVFGQRFIISVTAVCSNDATVWDISELAIPERAVIWELGICTNVANSQDSRLRLALGDQLPTTIAQMDGCRELIQGLGYLPSRPRRIYGLFNAGYCYMTMKKAIEASGQRLILEVYASADKNTNVRAHIVVSSMPKEVPDWLISGPGKNLI